LIEGGWLDVGRLNFEKKDEVEKISKRIRISYNKFSKRTDGSDDCVQEILTRMFEGKHQHSTIDQAVIDYLRANHGDTRLPGYSERQKLEYSDSLTERDMERVLGVVDARESSNGLDFDECSRWIGNQVDRAIFWLYYKWGMDEIEIGNIFGFSSSRVSQRIKRVQECISTRIKAKKPGALQEKVAIVLRQETERNLWGMGEITFTRMETGQSFSVESFNETSF
jgi:DNA-directed RNA polymerase specialized sigma24 family protein